MWTYEITQEFEDIVLEKDICDKPLIEGDNSQINQVLLNIAINANESIVDKGTINFKSDIVLTKSEQFLKDINSPSVNYVKITISDSGKGIPAQLYKRIFDPFYTTKTIGKRAGLGLSVAHNIVKNHKDHRS